MVDNKALLEVRCCFEVPLRRLSSRLQFSQHFFFRLLRAPLHIP